VCIHAGASLLFVGMVKFEFKSHLNSNRIE
jgi:hypothetical protein